MLYTIKLWEALILFHYLFIYLAAPVAYGSSQARDWIWAAAATYITTEATPDP